MNRLIGPIGVFGILLVSILFTAMNSGQTASINFGVLTFYRVPIVLVAFGGLVAGMILMLVVGVRSDLQVRRILRDRLLEEDREERERFVDQYQQDLFGEEADSS